MSDNPIIVLGIETSCDETAAAVVCLLPDGNVKVLSNVIYTQSSEHEGYGGVVPELAARAHVERADKITGMALEEAGIDDVHELNGVAATSGPGLIGGVMVGMMTAKAIALSNDIPFIPVNHLEGHALSTLLTETVSFPYLLLLVSGGHTQLLLVKDIGCYQRLGTTIDDAAGEAFDKTAKLLGLGQPGGPRVEKTAIDGNDQKYSFPRPLLKRDDCDFSFSGLKTALRLAAENTAPLSSQDKADLTASFQLAVARHLCAKTMKAMEVAEPEGVNTLVVAGGVAANGLIRSTLRSATEELGWKLVVPPLEFCTDNGAMIALAGAKKIERFGIPNQAETLQMAPRARWPLDDTPNGARHGGGKKGPKA
ncbi:MAG: tRNA (adenosine(37)-N6)-threonylcarbamoyltransferase complex transferase subunit TsaD [Aquisalinus sp.]|nr:tRNA (adenosine(37)-N6)-threonylcarbamoyltransferase complex transferase subunit TsaD [Aquisalinus sp.]